MNDVVTKEEFRGKRNTRNKTAKKFQSQYFDDAEQTRKAAGKRGHSRHIEVDDEIVIDEDDMYADLIDLRKIK